MFEDIINTGFTISTTISAPTPLTEENMMKKMNGNKDESTAENTNRFSDLNSNNAPPPWFKEYMEELKQDIVREVSTEVSKNVLETLDKCSAESFQLNYPFYSKRHNRHACNLRLEEKKQKKKKSSKKSKDTDTPMEHDKKCVSRNVQCMKKEVRKLQRKIDNTLERLEEEILSTLENTKHYGNVDEMVNDLDRTNDNEQENIAQCNVADEMLIYKRNLPLSRAQSQDRCNNIRQNENLPHYRDTELRMNCSLTGHQMLDKSCFNDDTECNESDIDKISICSDNKLLDLNDDHTFEMIQIPLNCDDNLPNCNPCTNELRGKKTDNVPLNDNLDDFEVCADDINRSNRDSLSFELLSETPSPPVSIYIDEDHFSSNENVVGTDKNGNDNTEESNLDKNILYIVDINGKVYNKHLPRESEKCVNTELEKRPGGTYSFIGETLPVNAKETCPVTESVHSEYRSESVCDLNMDVKSSHTSYPTNAENVNNKRSDVPLTQRCYQSQTDMGDFAQSFHSHTTSITNNDVYGNISSEVYASTSRKYTKQQVTADCTGKNKDTMQQNCQQTPRQAEKTASTKKGTKVNNKNVDKEEHRGHPTENDKCFCNHQSTTRGNADTQKTSSESSFPGAAEHVHILPETLVTGAVHVASIAYGTAREVLEKIRAHTKDDATMNFKRKGWH